MNSIRKYYFPNLCITFTLVNVIVAAMSVFGDNDTSDTQRFILQLAGYLGFIFVIDYFLEKIEFKKWFHQILAEFILNYAVFMVVAYQLNWFGFRAWNIIVNTTVFIIVFAMVWLRTYKLIKQDEAWINRMLIQRKTENSVM